MGFKLVQVPSDTVAFQTTQGLQAQHCQLVQTVGKGEQLERTGAIVYVETGVRRAVPMEARPELARIIIIISCNQSAGHCTKEKHSKIYL